MNESWSITRRRPAILLTALLLLTIGIIWGTHHAYRVMTINEATPRFAIIFAVAFFIFAWQMLLAHLERPYKTTPEQDMILDQLHIAVAVPVYNEDPQALDAMLRSVLRQQRQPQQVFIVDDGSNVDYSTQREWFLKESASLGIEGHWDRQANAGKRHAQANAFVQAPDADIYVTIDSDGVLADNAIEEILKPFASSKVMSVAGFMAPLNNTKNLLTRMLDLWIVVGQLVDRSSLSTMGSVLVNSGALAAYRGWIVRKHLDGYLNETFFGQKVIFSDDSMLTTYARTHGRTVQQTTAVCFPLMPENIEHHLRQYTRWMRGSFIRAWWRFRYLPLNSYAYWGHLLGWIQATMVLGIFIMLFIVQPFIDMSVMPSYLIIPLLIGYAQGLRYLSIKRSDQSTRSQLLTFALTPVITLWMFFALRLVKYYGWATHRRVRWGTRSEVEVRMQPALASAVEGEAA